MLVNDPVDPLFGELPREQRRALVRQLADQVGRVVAGRVQSAAEAGSPMSEAEEKVSSATEIQRALRIENERRLRAGWEPLSDAAQETLRDMVLAHVYGLGELEELWNHPDVEHIDANGPDKVFVTFVPGVVKCWSSIAETDEEYLDLIRRVARRMGMSEVSFDARSPKLDLQLPDGSRLFAVYGGKGTNGVAVQTSLSIRRHRFMEPSAADLVGLGLWPSAASEFVVAAMRAGENVIVAGDWAAGKTTLLRALIYSAVQPWERIVTIEAGITELGLHTSNRFENVVALFSRPAGPEGEGAVSPAELTAYYSRRLNATRLYLGEVLGDEVGPLLDAFTSNTRGSACTIHARSARAVVGRFEQYGLSASPVMPVEAVRWAMAEARPIIVHLAGDASIEGEMRRYCTSIVEVTGLEDGHVSMTELWGVDDADRLVPRHALSADRRRRLARRGWDWTIDGWADQLETGDGR